MILASLIRRIIGRGTIVLVDHKGRTATLGDGSTPRVKIRIADAATEWKIVLNPKLGAGEAFMDGRLIVEEGTLYDFLDLCLTGIYEHSRHGMARIPDLIASLTRRLHQYNPVGRARRNVAHHYDLSGRLYELFLDADRQYSCAYFNHPDVTLEEAQAAKKRHLAAKLRIEPGQRILDIGSGWGGLAIYLAEACGADVTGVTLSAEQYKAATERVAARGLSGRVRFLLMDYRDLDDRFDRIVSVGMFEHVGVVHYPEFFRQVYALLAEDGIAVIHSIGDAGGPVPTNPWIRKYIFPGGYIPALSEVVPPVERCGFWITDIEILRLHYAETLKAWRCLFEANRDEILDIYDERFCRMWEFYLVGSELFFRRLGGMNFQIQLAKQRDVIPITRDYMVDWERQRDEDIPLAAE